MSELIVDHLRVRCPHLSEDQIRHRLRTVEESLLNATSLQGTLACWTGRAIAHRVRAEIAAPAGPPVAKALRIAGTQRVAHRIGELCAGSGQLSWLAADVQSWVNYRHPGLQGRAEAWAMREGLLSLGEVVYTLGGHRRSTRLAAVNKVGAHGQRLLIEITAVLELGDLPVAMVSEVISARALAAAFDHPERVVDQATHVVCR